MSIGYGEQRTCAGEYCGTPLYWGVDPVMYVRTPLTDYDYCDHCAADVIGPAVDAIFSIFELTPEDEQEAVYSPFMWAAQ